MRLDKVHTLHTGVSLEVSALAVQALVADATDGKRLFELARIERLEDLHPYLTVRIRAGADGLVERRHRWAADIAGDLLAGVPVPYERFTKLFWRDMDEDDQDGDEWHRLVSGAVFGAQMAAVLDTVRSAQRALRRSGDVLVRLDMARVNGAMMAEERAA